MATIYNPDTILRKVNLRNATVSKLFVDLKDTGEIPHAELRLFLEENETDNKWNCSIGSNLGAVVNANSRHDIPISVQACQNPPANILMSFEFQLCRRKPTLVELVGVLGEVPIDLAEDFIGSEQDWTSLEQDLFQLKCFGPRGSRDIVLQWIARLCLLKLIGNNKAHAVVMPPDISLAEGMEPQLDFEEFITKDYTKSSSEVIQPTEDIPIDRGWFNFDYVRVTRCDIDIPQIVISPPKDEEHLHA